MIGWLIGSGAVAGATWAWHAMHSGSPAGDNASSWEALYSDAKEQLNDSARVSADIDGMVGIAVGRCNANPPCGPSPTLGHADPNLDAAFFTVLQSRGLAESLDVADKLFRAGYYYEAMTALGVAKGSV